MTTPGSSLFHIRTLVGSDNHQAPSNAYVLTKYKLYETRASFFIIGTDKSKKHWKVLKIDRCEPTELNIYEDPTIYSQHDCNDLLARLNAGNHSTGGLKFVTKVYGIVGFIKFLEPYYILLVTKRRLLGTISGHSIYGIGASQLMTITHPYFQTKVASSQAENRYKKLFNSVNLTKDFFFSYTYRIMWSLQKNVLEGEKEIIPLDDMFVWNSFLTYRFREQISNLRWLVALVHGFFKQKKLLSERTAVCKLTLIARRSRHFAGTRYFKRGVNEKGKVANDVETEQLVHEESEGKPGQISSVVQHRGSIPLFWSQDTSVLSPRPDIKLKREDPCYRATKLHFEDLAARYGCPIIVLNLIKTREKKPRETVLCHEYADALAYLNQSLPEKHKIKFVQWDFHKFARSAATNVLEVIGAMATDALNRVGFYCSSKPIFTTNKANECYVELSKRLEDRDGVEKLRKDSRKTRRLQHGVLRSNCIDCLDRTNVAQFCFGLAALGQQLQALGLHDDVQIAIDSDLGLDLMGIYEKMGDVLALQYGGSSAHNTVLSNRQGKWKAATQSLELLRAIKRHYSNAYTDGLKQDAINIFLGHYQPELGKPSLWQLDSDYHLQVRRAYCNPFGDGKPAMKRSFSADTIILSQAPNFRFKHPFSNGLSVELVSGAGIDTQPGTPEQEAVTCNEITSTASSPIEEQNQILPSLPGTIEEEDTDLPRSTHEGFCENAEEDKKEEKEEEEEEGKEEEKAAHYDTNSISMTGKQPHLLLMDGSLNIERQKPMEKHFHCTSESFVRWINSGHAFLL